jgi:hypothetical protein
MGRKTGVREIATVEERNAGNRKLFDGRNVRKQNSGWEEPQETGLPSRTRGGLVLLDLPAHVGHAAYQCAFLLLLLWRRTAAVVVPLLPPALEHRLSRRA